MSCSGSPSSAIRSALYPGAMLPLDFGAPDHHRDLAQIVPASIQDVRGADDDLPGMEGQCREQRKDEKDGSHAT